jgi:deazaflavin-dependent oxidoreductase (nitroreductase family)
MLELTAKLKANPRLTETMGPVHLLAVPGRTSGELRSTPVSPITYDGARWLVGAFGTADWVKNLRASAWGMLTKGTRVERITTAEVPLQQQVAVLREYVRQPFAQQSGAFTVSADAPFEEMAAAVERHPIFKIVTTEPAAT